VSAAARRRKIRQLCVHVTVCVAGQFAKPMHTKLSAAICRNAPRKLCATQHTSRRGACSQQPTELSQRSNKVETRPAAGNLKGLRCLHPLLCWGACGCPLQPSTHRSGLPTGLGPFLRCASPSGPLTADIACANADDLHCGRWQQVTGEALGCNGIPLWASEPGSDYQPA